MYTLGFEYRTKPLFFGRAAEDRFSDYYNAGSTFPNAGLLGKIHPNQRSRSTAR